MSSVAPELAFTAACLPGSPCSSVRSKRTPASWPPSAEARKALGERRKRSQMTRFDVLSRCAKFAAICSRMLTERFFIRLFASSCSLAALRQSASSSGSTTGRTSSLMVRSSRSSAFVKAACTKPRRPTRCTVRRPLRCHSPMRARAPASMSVGCSSRGGRQSTRAMSRATLPWPRTTAVSPGSGGSRAAWSGWPLYHFTKAGAPTTPGRSSPGMPSSRSPCAPVHMTTASYMRRSSPRGRSLPISTLPKKRNAGVAATSVKSLTTFLTSGWSGATPKRTRPKGVGRRSNMSTLSSPAAAPAAAPACLKRYFVV
mmetsp:Transcript_96179/g.310542  ORF Transcript_96179/g.310542 Transcript_96179/m.310542 type:complete len:314 (-) Transcript_96179:45-986(-)